MIRVVDSRNRVSTCFTSCSATAVVPFCLIVISFLIGLLPTPLSSVASAQQVESTDAEAIANGESTEADSTPETTSESSVASPSATAAPFNSSTVVITPFEFAEMEEALADPVSSADSESRRNNDEEEQAWELAAESDLNDELSSSSAEIDLDTVIDASVLGEDEIWLVSSRGIGCPGCDDSGLSFQQRRDCTWVGAARADFDRSLEASMQTVVFVHGNRTDLSYAVRRGLQAYQSFISQAPRIAPIRFVIWAWPSEQESLGLRDFREKADRADLEGCLFGTFLSRLPSDQQLNLIAYSYGSRIVLGGVSMLTGNSLLGRTVSLPEGYSPPPMRVTLIAAAAPPGSLLPGARYAPAYSLIDRLVLINNREDRALKLYRLVDRATSSIAMGSQGFATGRLPDSGLRVAQWDVSRHVGPQHKIDLYFGSSVVGRLVRDQVAWVANDRADTPSADSGSSSGRR